jgi:hypothetical protein
MLHEFVDVIKYIVLQYLLESSYKALLIPFIFQFLWQLVIDSCHHYKWVLGTLGQPHWFHKQVILSYWDFLCVPCRVIFHLTVFHKFCWVFPCEFCTFQNIQRARIPAGCQIYRIVVCMILPLSSTSSTSALPLLGGLFSELSPLHSGVAILPRLPVSSSGFSYFGQGGFGPEGPPYKSAARSVKIFGCLTWQNPCKYVTNRTRLE